MPNNRDTNGFGTFNRRSDYADDEGDSQQDGAGSAKQWRHRADELMRALIANDDVTLFRTRDNEAFATVRLRGVLEHIPVKGRDFEDWLLRWVQERDKPILGPNDLGKIVSNLAARALGNRSWQEIAYRVARSGERLYIDLGDEVRSVVEIWPARAESAERWRVIKSDSCPVRFVRRPKMRPLPAPVEGGTVEDFRKFFNVATEGDFKLLMCHVITAFHPEGPYPIGLVHGQQGSGKTTLCRLVVALTDPQDGDIRALPKDPRDLAVGAQHSRVLAFDNASGISGDMSDSLCRLSTGDAIVLRKLNTDAEQVILKAKRPVLVSSIIELARRPDLADRAIIIEARVLEEGERRTEEDIWRDFEAERGLLFGVLCDLLSAALANYGGMKPPEGIRMADAARWALAAVQYVNWSPEELTKIWLVNRRAANIALLENDVVASALLDFLAKQPEACWEGSTSDLLVQLNNLVTNRVRQSKRWPATHQALTAHLTRLMPALPSKGWALVRDKGTKGARSIEFRRLTTD